MALEVRHCTSPEGAVRKQPNGVGSDLTPSSLRPRSAPLYQITFWCGSPWASALGPSLALRLAPNRTCHCIPCCQSSDSRGGTNSEHVLFLFLLGHLPAGREVRGGATTHLRESPSSMALGRPASAGCSPRPPLHATAGLTVTTVQKLPGESGHSCPRHSPPPTPGGHTASIYLPTTQDLMQLKTSDVRAAAAHGTSLLGHARFRWVASSCPRSGAHSQNHSPNRCLSNTQHALRAVPGRS